MTSPPDRRLRSAPTLSDVAKAAGVSPMTVSRVINRDRKVRPETRERVNAAIETLNYSPNPAARALAGAVKPRIALLYGNPSPGWLSEVLVGALEEATRSDVQLLLERTGGAAGPETARRLVAQGVDGVVLPPPFCDDPELAAALDRAGLIRALVACATPDLAAFAVSIDDAGAARDMTAHLIGLGHRRIGFITGNPAHSASALRQEGYRQALEAAGIGFDPDLVAPGDFTFRSGLIAAERLLSLSPRPTALFASNDDMAAAAVSAAHARRLATPGDVSVCGFDDTALATTIAPELTTIRQPAATMTQAVVAMLAEACRDQRQGRPVAPAHRLFGHELVRRQSDQAP